MRRVEASRLAAGLVAFTCVCLVALGWHGATATGPEGGYDSPAFIAYTATLSSQHRLPTNGDTYEFATPPLYPALAGALQRVADATGDKAASIVPSGHGPWWRLAWAAASAAAIALLVVFRRGERGWLTGAILAALAGIAALLAVDASAAGVRWTAGQALALAWAVGLVVASWLLAREVWPARPLQAALAAVIVATVPIVLRLGAMFHPETQFACLAALALLLAVRASRKNWALGTAAWLGATLGLAGLTRPTAGVVIASLGTAILLSGRRAALRFVGVAAGVMLVVAGAWWVRQTVVYGNPFQSNLDRYTLTDGQPRSFYVSFPLADLVLRPYRPHFAGELWPQFHADLWSDWFGAQHGFWPEPPDRATNTFLSSQSLLGFGAAILAIGGVLGLGGPAVGRAFRGAIDHADFTWAAFLLLAALSWIAFVVTLVRFPQAGGDPIKASYLLYLTPVFVISGLAAGDELWRRAVGWRVVLSVWVALYAVSAAGYLATAYR